MNTNIEKIINDYMNAMEQRKYWEKIEKANKKLIEEFSKKENFETDNYIAVYKKTFSTILDTDSLYKDFPTIKNDYGKVSEKSTLTITEKGTIKKTA